LHQGVKSAPDKETAMKRFFTLLLLSTVMTLFLPARAAAAAPSLSLTCSTPPAGFTLVCALSGRGFAPSEQLQISYRVALLGPASVQQWTRTGTAASHGSFVRPKLAVDIRSGQSFQVTATVTGNAGSRAVASATGRYLTPSTGNKHIVVSLSKQRLNAYVGQRLVYSSPITTGNPRLPTPPGRYSIFAKYHPYRFVSPWPVGSPYWYAPSWTSYAMQFRADGYFIHDAPWRSVFGPFSNGAGQPGTNYGGTHGCVNAPVSAAQFVYTWAPVGTRVVVVP
jgi:lipoprotein-anchoring transpeptidase ErfK/SrfK